ncbi:uncharacterized protein LOC130556584 isoform X2 [Triplophysa rosa]|uniref:uncharacterized protein LOC130556584 isoform X2 n=1 Tax=Triplophysa rosa TaxID=992332 RepID=UPI002545EACC|nr:uncharacterized protein LOC130556584 isoform X2 [Triplophysa rosa]
MSGSILETSLTMLGLKCCARFPVCLATILSLQKECNAVVIGDSIVRNVRASSTKGKVRTHCFPGARVLDVSAQVPEILKDEAKVGAVVLHAGVNDVRMRQSEILKRDFRSLIETVRNASATARIIVSGPLPTYRRGNEKERLFSERTGSKVDEREGVGSGKDQEPRLELGSPRTHRRHMSEHETLDHLAPFC